jgi:hypothetical protein
MNAFEIEISRTPEGARAIASCPAGHEIHEVDIFCPAGHGAGDDVIWWVAAPSGTTPPTGLIEDGAHQQMADANCWVWQDGSENEEPAWVYPREYYADRHLYRGEVRTA